MVAILEDELQNDIQVEITEQTDDDDYDKPQHIRYDITAFPTDFTIKVIYEKWKNDQLLIPAFQRNYVWSLTQASRFIESFLLGLPIPQVFLYRKTSRSKPVVVDGQQRISTIVRFYSGNFDEGRVFRLSGVDSRWNGKSYEELSEEDQGYLDDCALRSIIIQQLQPDGNSSVYQVFERLNTGGTQLNAMEIRKAIFQGQAMELLERLNLDKNWGKLIGMAQPHKRLRDVEFVLRILALAARRNDYYTPTKDFLTDYIDELSKARQEELQCIEGRFREASRVVYEQIGDKPFHLRGPLNLAALDSVMATAVESLDILDSDLKNNFKRLCESSNFIEVTTKNTSHVQVVEARFKVVRSSLLKS